jgi:ribose transport system ATP-binding protein
MVGRELGELFPRTNRVPGEPILDLMEVCNQVTTRPASLQLRRGEILGLAGLVGAGRTELLRSIFGLDAITSGAVRVQHFSGGYATPRQRIAQGIGYLSEDRKSEGLAINRSIEDNVTYSALERHAWHGWLNLGKRRSEVAQWLGKLGIKTRGPMQAVGELSGGNQQKVALARILHQQADVILLDEPTRGIDVGSKTDVYRLISEQAALGKGVLVVSSYLPELFGICDRIAVMTRGTLSGCRPVSEWTETRVMDVATRG